MENTRDKNEYAFGLIIDEMDGVLTGEKKVELEKWLNADPENRRIYDEFYEINHRMDLFSASEKLDVTESWNILEGKLVEPLVSPNATVKPISRKWLAIAASIVLFVAVGSRFSSWFLTQTIRTGATEVSTLQLPDGSSVTLNANSELKYNKFRYRLSRQLNLVSGEAFFDVIHRPTDPLSVDLGTIRLTDLGTSFNVKKTGKMVEVIVSSGKVNFENTATSQKIPLLPGMKGVFLPSATSLVSTENTNPNFKAWADKKIIFDHTPLREVARQLAIAYQCRVTVTDPTIELKELSGKFSLSTADSVLSTIKVTLGLSVRKTDNGFEISQP